MNRATRRKHVKTITNNVLKGRAEAVKKKQYGFGLIVTNRMITIMFLRWVWTPWDRRLR